MPEDFDILGYENLLPCRPGSNLQKAALVLDAPHAHFFLAIAASKKVVVESHIADIKKRTNRGKALIMLQQCLESGQLDAPEVISILEKYKDQPDEIFHLLEGMTFADTTEIRAIAKADIDDLRDRPIRMGQDDDMEGVTLINDDTAQVQVRTCREYNDAINAGFYAQSTYEIKMATFFEHQCGLLTALEAATTPEVSFITAPRVGIIDLELMPFSLFPGFGDSTADETQLSTYQDKVSDGTIVVTRLRQNLLEVAEPEGMGQQLIEVARADFNGDGIEDILLFEYCWATHGSLGYGGVKILTRKSIDSPFELAVKIAPQHR